MVVLGAALMVAHDILTGVIIFFVVATWALQISRQRKPSATNTREGAVGPNSQRFPRS